MKKLPFVELLGINIHSLTVGELIKALGELVTENKKCVVANVNIHAMNIAVKNETFKKFLNDALINFCDGDGVRFGASLQGKHIEEKITYNRLIYQLAEYSQDQNISWYMLGSKPGVTDVAHDKLMAQFPKLKIAGHHHGYISDPEIKAAVI